jgi:hypothetical protein
MPLAGLATPNAVYVALRRLHSGAPSLVSGVFEMLWVPCMEAGQGGMLLTHLTAFHSQIDADCRKMEGCEAQGQKCTHKACNACALRYKTAFNHSEVGTCRTWSCNLICTYLTYQQPASKPACKPPVADTICSHGMMASQLHPCLLLATYLLQQGIASACVYPAGREAQ